MKRLSASRAMAPAIRKRAPIRSASMPARRPAATAPMTWGRNIVAASVAVRPSETSTEIMWKFRAVTSIAVAAVPRLRSQNRRCRNASRRVLDGASGMRWSASLGAGEPSGYWPTSAGRSIDPESSDGQDDEPNGERREDPGSAPADGADDETQHDRREREQDRYRGRRDTRTPGHGDARTRA